MTNTEIQVREYCRNEVVSGKLNHNKEPWISSRYAKKMAKTKKEKADKMFEELGYKKSICEDGNSEEFINEKRNIDFYDECKEVGIKQYSITMPELKAIYKKCEEKNWL